MNKKERKRRAAKIRRNQKLARKAHRDPSGQANRDADTAQGSEPTLRDTSGQADRVMPGGPDSVAHRETSAQAEIQTRQDESPTPETTGEGAGATGRRISDSRARAMLEDAAEFLNELVVRTRDALKKVAPERVAAAMEVVEAKGSADNGGTPQQQPRRAPDPLVTMIKQGISASNLLKRIISTLYPKLAKIEVPALV